MQAVVDALWTAFGASGYSWVGFYEIDEAQESMTLACRQPKPACSPIGLHGCCGRSWRERASIVVRDVAALGNGYIACDPRDRSEVVVPMFNANGSCWGVLDVDSFDVGTFSDHDAIGLARLCERAGLSAPIWAPILRI
jgi:putative methionine-R-sulfoxide reductase with GAF domain